MFLPFIVLGVFALDSHLFSAVGITEDSVSHISFLRNQQQFLTSKNIASSMIDFRLFEIFIWIASAIGLSRILTGLCARGVLESYRDKLILLGKAGRSTTGAVGTLLLIGPFAIFCSTNFAFASASDQVRYLMEHSPKGFLCLETFIFCGGQYFRLKGCCCSCGFCSFREKGRETNDRFGVTSGLQTPTVRRPLFPPTADIDPTDAHVRKVP
jgi:hypothetical protein